MRAGVTRSFIPGAGRARSGLSLAPEVALHTVGLPERLTEPAWSRPGPRPQGIQSPEMSLSSEGRPRPAVRTVLRGDRAATQCRAELPPQRPL